MAFDRHMNLVLGDAEEYRKLPPKKGRSEDEVSCRCWVCSIITWDATLLGTFAETGSLVETDSLHIERSHAPIIAFASCRRTQL